jgi:Rhodanese-like domain
VIKGGMGSPAWPTRLQGGNYLIEIVGSVVQSTPTHIGSRCIIVSPAWVKTMIDRHSPVRRRNHFVILEASWAGLAEARDYLAGHIPGALHLGTDEFENGYPRWLLRRPRELQRVIGALGITPTTTVLMYGRQTIAAARTAGKRFTRGALLYTGAEAVAFGTDLFALPLASLWQPMFSDV